MDDAFPLPRLARNDAVVDVVRPARPRPAQHLWPLMGDITSAHADVPDLLIHWARARSEDDPLPR